MRVSKLLLALALIVPTQAFAYDGFQADFAVCTQGNNKGEVVAACTRLIDNAAAENATIGTMTTRRRTVAMPAGP
jgi:hypothetical protein